MVWNVFGTDSWPLWTWRESDQGDHTGSVRTDMMIDLEVNGVFHLTAGNSVKDVDSRGRFDTITTKCRTSSRFTVSYPASGRKFWEGSVTE